MVSTGAAPTGTERYCRGVSAADDAGDECFVRRLQIAVLETVIPAADATFAD